VPNPDIPETHDVLLARARELHPAESIPDDAPSRFKKEGAEAPAAGAAAKPAPAAVPAPAPVAAAAPAAVEAVGLSLPTPDEWEIPVRCFRCTGEYAVPFAYFRAGMVFYCPHCNGSFVPTLGMVRAVEDALGTFHAGWTRAFDDFHARRRRELERFEERQRAELERFTEALKDTATRAKAPGAPTKRKGFFTF
jgi:hypothetical protein